jgi:hypothetical protein
MRGVILLVSVVKQRAGQWSAVLRLLQRTPVLDGNHLEPITRRWMCETQTNRGIPSPGRSLRLPSRSAPRDAGVESRPERSRAILMANSVNQLGRTRVPTTTKGPRGARGATGSTGRRGRTGPAGPGLTREQILAAVQDEFIELGKHLRTQLERTAQMQLQLDAIHNLLKQMLRGPANAK